jgi:hypothetical protein
VFGSPSVPEFGGFSIRSVRFPTRLGGPHIEATYPDGRVGQVTPGPQGPQPGDVILAYFRGSGGSDEMNGR